MTEFRIVRGNPSAEEVAIALAVLKSAVSMSIVPGQLPTPRHWAAPRFQHRPTTHRFGRKMWTLSQRVG